MVDRPVVQHVVDEAREAGIEHFVFVTGRGKAVIEDHFDMSYELEDTLRRRNKTKEYDALMADLPKAGATSFTRQQAPLGLGHAVWCARDIIGDEPFAVLLPDMITLPNGPRKSSCLAQAIEAYGKRRQYHRGRGGIAERDASIRHCERRRGLWPQFEINGMVEKPPQGTAPSNWSFPAAIFRAGDFELLEKGEKGAGREIQLTDAMIKLAAAQAQYFHGVRFDGEPTTRGRTGVFGRQHRLRAGAPGHCRRLRAEIKRLLG